MGEEEVGGEDEPLVAAGVVPGFLEETTDTTELPIMWEEQEVEATGEFPRQAEDDGCTHTHKHTHKEIHTRKFEN